MKKINIVILATILLFSLSLSFGKTSEAASFTYKKGDILITKTTSSKGILGHSAIVVDSGHVMHTSGWKSEPYPAKFTIAKWTSRYKTVKVVRPSSSTLGAKAAANAMKYFYGKKIKYKITKNPTDINPTLIAVNWYGIHTIKQAKNLN
jgi:hypothetical protein